MEALKQELKKFDLLSTQNNILEYLIGYCINNNEFDVSSITLDFIQKIDKDDLKTYVNSEEFTIYKFMWLSYEVKKHIILLFNNDNIGKYLFMTEITNSIIKYHLEYNLDPSLSDESLAKLLFHCSSLHKLPIHLEDGDANYEGVKDFDSYDSYDRFSRKADDIPINDKFVIELFKKYKTALKQYVNSNEFTIYQFMFCNKKTKLYILSLFNSKKAISFLYCNIRLLTNDLKQNIYEFYPLLILQATKSKKIIEIIDKSSSNKQVFTFLQTIGRINETIKLLNKMLKIHSSRAVRKPNAKPLGNFMTAVAKKPGTSNSSLFQQLLSNKDLKSIIGENIDSRYNGVVKSKDTFKDFTEIIAKLKEYKKKEKNNLLTIQKENGESDEKYVYFPSSGNGQDYESIDKWDREKEIIDNVHASYNEESFSSVKYTSKSAKTNSHLNSLLRSARFSRTRSISPNEM